MIQLRKLLLLHAIVPFVYSLPVTSYHLPVPSLLSNSGAFLDGTLPATDTSTSKLSSQSTPFIGAIIGATASLIAILAIIISVCVSKRRETKRLASLEKEKNARVLSFTTTLGGKVVIPDGGTVIKGKSSRAPDQLSPFFNFADDKRFDISSDMEKRISSVSPSSKLDLHVSVHGIRCENEFYSPGKEGDAYGGGEDRRVLGSSPSGELPDSFKSLPEMGVLGEPDGIDGRVNSGKTIRAISFDYSSALHVPMTRTNSKMNQESIIEEEKN